MTLSRSEKSRTMKLSLRRLRAIHYPEYVEIRNNIAKHQTMPGDLNNKQVTKTALTFLRKRYRLEWESLRQQAILEGKYSALTN